MLKYQFYKSVTLRTTFKSAVKEYIALQKFQIIVCHFWLSSFFEIWDRICATEESRRKKQSLKHKMLHLGHFWVMILMMLTDMNAQIHNDNSMFSKRFLLQSYHIMKTGIKKDIFEQNKRRSFQKLCFMGCKIFR